MTQNTRTNVYIGAIYRCSLEDEERIERYNTPKEGAEWVYNQQISRATIRAIANKITVNISGGQLSAYGYVWKIDDDDLPGEMWKEVPDYLIDGHKNVFASSEGRIKRRNFISYGYVRKNENYKVIGIGRDQYLVQRLVAFAFLPNFYGLPLVEHKDDNKLNNRLYNLKWSTYSDNGKNAFKTGAQKFNKVLNQYDLNDNFIEQFNSAEDVKRKYGYDPTCIHDCCKGKTKKSYNFKWKYV